MLTPKEEIDAARKWLAPLANKGVPIIDAQLEILTAASVDEYEAKLYWAEQGKPHLRGPAKIVPINRAALSLARAINEPW